MSRPALAAEDDALRKLEHDSDEVSSRAIYEAAGIRFNGSGSSWSTIGGYATSSMTWSGTGGIMLYNAFTNLDNAIATVDAKVANAVTTSTLDEVFQKYFATGGGENMWYYSNQVYSFLKDLPSKLSLIQSNVAAITSSFGSGKRYNLLTWQGTYIRGNFVDYANALIELLYLGLHAVQDSVETTNGYIGSLGQIYDATGGYKGYGSLQASLGALSKLIYDTSTTGNSLGSYLSVDGHLSSAAYLTAPQLLRTGLVGLSYNLAGSDKSTTFSLLVPNEGEDGGMREDEKRVDNLLDALGLLGTSLQNPLAKLQYVLADDDDISLKDKTKPNQDAVEDNFTGDGPGAVKPGQIGDIGDISSSAGDAFGGAGSAGDAFIAITDSNSYSFFSQAVSDALDTVGSVSARSDEDFMEGFELGDDGFYHVKDTSAWDVTAFLGG